MTFGILTLATRSDYQQAIGLALSARVSNPGVPLAVACSPEVRPLLSPYFDKVVFEDPAVRGFAHKLNLDRYSPFEKTFFFDSDVLLFRPLHEVLNQWAGKHNRLVHIDGAGHAYFEKPTCQEVFDLARSIAANYRHYAGEIRLADEDVMNITMTLLGLTPMSHFGFWSIYASVKKGTLKMNAAAGKCSMMWADTGEVCRPYMMHFLANQAPVLHTLQLRKLFRKFGVSTNGLLFKAAQDMYIMKVAWPIRGIVRSLIKVQPGKGSRDHH